MYINMKCYSVLSTNCTEICTSFKTDGIIQNLIERMDLACSSGRHILPRDQLSVTSDPHSHTSYSCFAEKLFRRDISETSGTKPIQ
jgi:hypothetical protein